MSMPCCVFKFVAGTASLLDSFHDLFATNRDLPAHSILGLDHIFTQTVEHGLVASTWSHGAYEGSFKSGRSSCRNKIPLKHFTFFKFILIKVIALSIVLRKLIRVLSAH